jgi:hypothetical protein
LTNDCCKTIVIAKGGDFKMASKKNGVTQEEFIQIKTLLSVPLTKTEIEEKTGRSYSTITRVDETDSFEAYQTLVTTQNKEYNTALKNKLNAKKEESKMTFGERQTELDENQVVEAIAEKVVPAEKQEQENRYEALFTLEKEILEIKKQLLEVEREIANETKALKQSLTENLTAMGVNTQAVKDLTDAIKE